MIGNRGGVGRAPKPMVLHQLHGTVEPSRHGDRRYETLTVGNLVNPPEGMTKAQRDEWAYAIQHAPRDLLKLIDRNTLRMWCEASARHRWAMMKQAEQDRTAEYPLLVERDGNLIPSPYLAVMDKAALLMLRLAVEMGFTPSARGRLRAEKPVINGTSTAVVPTAKADPWAFMETKVHEVEPA